ncbi:MAG TPA: GatB/YqeY domain-containing protein [Candidatus Dormibacteraeota bacterium]|nr:GatB/YqeY domain-containing protein [Candidatus Dormibacteraeota bacterium]
MALSEQIQKDLIEAMKARDELRSSVLRMVKTALKLKEVEKTRPLDDAESIQVLQTLVKQRRESIEQFRQGGRDDLADREAQEITVLERYLPAAPTDSEMQAAIEAAIAETGASSPKQMGLVIKATRARLEGKAIDGKLLSERIRQRLEKNA